MKSSTLAALCNAIKILHLGCSLHLTNKVLQVSPLLQDNFRRFDLEVVDKDDPYTCMWMNGTGYIKISIESSYTY